jgi:threonine/homoserine/homoserine lactone efflux protein
MADAAGMTAALVSGTLLSPNPWLFWMTVGAATLARTISSSGRAAALFLIVFYGWLVGIKMAMAMVAGSSREFFGERPYRVTMRVLGALLAVFGVLLLRDGVLRLD